jgi:uncharacterized protein
MYKNRYISDHLLKLVNNFPVVAVSGARQVGKSTLLAHLFGDKYRTVIFDPLIDIQNARSEPDLFLANNPGPMILDEIQYAPEVVPAIKRLVDKNRGPGMFLLSGSQQWEVMKSLSESLAGRIVFADLMGFSAGERADADLKTLWLPAWLMSKGTYRPNHRMAAIGAPLTELIFRGSLPEAAFISQDLLRDFFIGYERTYIERDARLMTEFADVRVFARFFRLAAALTAQEMNHHQLGRELDITPQTARRWLGVLEATYQWFEIPAYSANAIKRLSEKPKGYLGDTGLACFAQSVSSSQSLPDHPLWGALFETFIAGEIRKQLQVLPVPASLFHWRTHAGAEVDLIIECEGMLYPVEIKTTSHPSKADTRGIQAFRKTYPGAKIGTGLVVCAADTCFSITDNEIAMPWDASV